MYSSKESLAALAIELGLDGVGISAEKNKVNVYITEAIVFFFLALISIYLSWNSSDFANITYMIVSFYGFLL
ncbi:hypothetical protein BK141_21800 [Paenibacillus sp. FSL R5-0765]|nr:hypothetical protein BK141_21800 [Paenibacillus sp. FSL R5-0765]